MNKYNITFKNQSLDNLYTQKILRVILCKEHSYFDPNINIPANYFP